jgi:predicted dehydrogenase
MPDKLRVGIIGCGGISRNHIRGYLTCGRYEVVALADLNQSAMEEKDIEFDLNTRHYRDAREMLDDQDLDVVSISTWHMGHATWTIAAAARKPKAIICEKPMAESLGRAEEMLVACQRNGVKLVIGHQRRFLPAYTLARELIAEGAIGQVQLIVSFGGDGLPNYCSHQTDMYRYLLNDDDCEWVMGSVERKTDRYERNTRIEDAAIGVFQFKGGARTLILADVTPTVYQGAYIYGSEGQINMTTNNLQLLNKDTKGLWETRQPEGKFCKVEDDPRAFEWVEGASGQADELADWIEGKADDHRGNGLNGYKALEMLMGVYESARCHEKVILPLQTRLNPLDLMIDSGHLAVERPGRYDIRARLLRGEAMLSDGADRAAG